MEKHKVHSLLIMDGDDYQGLLSARNILETATKQKKPQNFSINIKGLHDVNLTEHQESAMLKIIERESEKLQRKVSYKFSVSVHLKETSKEGKQKEFEVKFRITAPGNRLATTKSSWDLETAIHKCFNVVKAQLER
jgi:ribosome-associated translation inhibitor RaiA